MLSEVFYQVAIIDAARRGESAALMEAVRAAATDRGLDPRLTFRFFEGADADNMKGNAPQVTVYWGGAGYDTSYDDVVTRQTQQANPVIPVVPSTLNFQSQVPPALGAINGMGIPIGGDLAPLVALILENLKLLRSRRRVFLSYKRVEAQNAAMQLYHELDARSFDPFLDTHSIRQGDVFQERLWHRMADCDLVVLFYTQDVLGSGWVLKELDRASAMGISVLQLIWPDVKRDRRTELFTPLYLDKADFQADGQPAGGQPAGDPQLTAAAVERIALEIERLRARAMAARESRLLKTLCGAATDLKIPYLVRQAGSVDFCIDGDKFTRVCIGVGVPEATTFHETVEPPPTPAAQETWLMYDPVCIAPFHQTLLDWLRPVLPVGTIVPQQVDAWLKSLRCP